MSDSLQPYGLQPVGQASQSMEFSRQECWNGLQCPPPGDPPSPGIESLSHASFCNGTRVLHHYCHLGSPYLKKKLYSRSQKCSHLFRQRQFSSIAQSCLTLCHPMDCRPPCTSVHGNSPGKNAGMGCHTLLQGIFPTQDPIQVSHIASKFFTS